MYKEFATRLQLFGPKKNLKQILLLQQKFKRFKVFAASCTILLFATRSMGTLSYFVQQ